MIEVDSGCREVWKMRKQANRSWLDILQHLGQTITALVALVFSVQRLIGDFQQQSE